MTLNAKYDTSQTASSSSSTGLSVLISGGSIAGPALAWWLNKYGYRTTIVERWHELRPGGQNIDVRGVGRDIITKMGLFEQIRSHNTSEEGFQFVSSDGKPFATFKASANGPTAELEILRGDFAQILYDATKKRTQYIFGDSIKRIDDEENGDVKHSEKAAVTFQSGRQEDFDIVVIADGVRSRTRKLVFGHEATLQSIGMSVAYGTIPRIASDTPFFRWYIASGRRSIITRPDPYGTTRACLSYMSDADPASLMSGKDEHERLSVLRRRFSGAGWETQRILDAFEQTDDLYCEDLVQVKAPRYSKGRVVMIGDAAFCATPESGQGTTLSLCSAYILAHELAKAGSDYRKGFEAYEQEMRPVAVKAQKLPPGSPGIVHPESEWAVWALKVVASLGEIIIALPWPECLVNWVTSQDFGTNKIRVPDYKALQ